MVYTPFDTVILFGGTNASALNEVFKFTVSTSTWTQGSFCRWSSEVLTRTCAVTPGGPTAIPAAYTVGVVTSMNTMLVFGGQSTANVDLNVIQKYDLETDSWVAVTPTGTPPTARHGQLFHSN